MTCGKGHFQTIVLREAAARSEGDQFTGQELQGPTLAFSGGLEQAVATSRLLIEYYSATLTISSVPSQMPVVLTSRV
jgi:hypothetical protein